MQYEERRYDVVYNDEIKEGQTAVNPLKLALSKAP